MEALFFVSSYAPQKNVRLLRLLLLLLLLLFLKDLSLYLCVSICHMSAESVGVRRGYQTHLQLELQAAVSCLI